MITGFFFFFFEKDKKKIILRELRGSERLCLIQAKSQELMCEGQLKDLNGQESSPF